MKKSLQNVWQILFLALLFSPAFLWSNETYRNLCSACHQANGAGVEAVFPPLKGWVNRLAEIQVGREYLVQVISFGMNGEIEIEGTSYIGYMPPNPQLTDSEMAAVLNYILRDLSGDRSIREFSVSEVQAIRSRKLTMDQVLESRKKAIRALKN